MEQSPQNNQLWEQRWRILTWRPFRGVAWSRSKRGRRALAASGCRAPGPTGWGRRRGARRGAAAWRRRLRCGRGTTPRGSATTADPVRGPRRRPHRPAAAPSTAPCAGRGTTAPARLARSRHASFPSSSLNSCEKKLKSVRWYNNAY